MKSLDELLAIAQGLRTDIANEAVGNAEVAERLVVVSDGTASVLHSKGLETYEGGGVIAFVNDSGIPFVEQADQLIDQAASLKPQAVLLGGSALTGRPGKGFRRILAVQMFCVRPEIRTAWISEVTDDKRLISSVGPWRESKAGPRIWVEEILSRAG
ncbi:hypothetical protein HD597_011210 [Nonomuraea thailandensis]|uniref:Uncharacterized protein n=1 Tax=Nonomuraea thailandensis TaxID=1188745 RepID=A0A9X2GUM1_9ACTN|nr:hypothetical protein [Nonomuraea thailandensis]MCP2364190.1 hypothetical protein [Nonomuraea thailandensis]